MTVAVCALVALTVRNVYLENGGVTAERTAGTGVMRSGVRSKVSDIKKKCIIVHCSVTVSA